MQTINLREVEPLKYKLECDSPVIPTEVVQQIIDELSTTILNKVSDTFTSTDSGKYMSLLALEVKHYKLMNKVLFITNILTCLYFLYKSMKGGY